MCFHYDESADICSTRIVKTRKPHRCTGCQKLIESGAVMECCSGLFDGAWFRYYTCEDCKRMVISIAAVEIREGCLWRTAWCHPNDLRGYVLERNTPVPLLSGTLDECMAQVNDLWANRLNRRS